FCGCFLVGGVLVFCGLGCFFLVVCWLLLSWCCSFFGGFLCVGFWWCVLLVFFGLGFFVCVCGVVLWLVVCFVCVVVGLEVGVLFVGWCGWVVLVGLLCCLWCWGLFGGGVAGRLLGDGLGLEFSVLEDSEALPDQPPRA
ncbi:hypothetical protein, partial [Pseudomonas syringae group genomosp. 7]|uniref:hypothetical protein n=1 Tax=Pseudomonas syringae group genomosp. 7 TaxID=251699 RepID=UPI0037703D92